MAGRRGNNEGSITQRPDGRWEARITLDGNKRKSFYGKTRQEVARTLAEALRDRDKGLPIVGERQTVAQYATNWLQSVEPTIGPTTIPVYERHIRLRIIPSFGSLALAKLTPQHIQMLYTRELEKGLSPNVVRQIHAVLHHMLKDAFRLGLVQRNVTEMIDPPRKHDSEMKIYTEEQARQFLEAARGHRLEALFILALTTGMREGELQALRWQDVSLELCFLQVRSSAKPIRGKLVLAETKTKRSRRRIALTPLAAAALRRHRTRQLEERLALGLSHDDLDLVFPNTVGRLLDKSNLYRSAFMPIMKKAGLPRIRFHDLRHTAATLLLLHKVNPKVVSEMLGHTSVAFTLDRYGHVLPDMQHDAVEVMQRILG